jgi:exopolysaccharide production protein ExoY
MLFSIIKRLMDITVATLGLIVFSPVMLVTAILIKATSKGPVFAETPKRVGMNGKSFNPYKFRSMIANAHKLLKTDPRFKKLFEQYKKSNYKLHDDPRITPVGKFIRKHSIDEVPQFLNVLKGEMSVVGPRPYYPDELDDQLGKNPDKRCLYKDVISVRPGITGYWQVSGRSDVDFAKRIEMDAYYARKRSLWLDILIMLKTPIVMISGQGAV